MKRLYMTPSVIVAEYEGNEMIAQSAKISTNSTTGDPYGENLGNIKGDAGNAWGDAAVKGSIWDDE